VRFTSDERFERGCLVREGVFADAEQLGGPYTVHGSGPSTSANPRRVLINGYACPGADRLVYPGSGTGRDLTASEELS
jgi:hypothetical protein